MAYRGFFGFEFAEMLNKKTHKPEITKITVTCPKCRNDISARGKTVAKAEAEIIKKIDSHIDKNPARHPGM